jgi:hypothetical protein
MRLSIFPVKNSKEINCTDIFAGNIYELELVVLSQPAPRLRLAMLNSAIVFLEFC